MGRACPLELHQPPAQHRILGSPSPNPLHCGFLSPWPQPTPIPDITIELALCLPPLFPQRSAFPTLASPSPLGDPRLGREGHTLHPHPPSLHHVFNLEVAITHMCHSLPSFSLTPSTKPRTRAHLSFMTSVPASPLAYLISSPPIR